MESYKKLSTKAAGLFTGMIEVWKDIQGFEGHYQVSSFGNVKSLARMRIGKGGSLSPLKERVMSLKLSKTGYYIVGLCKGGEKTHPSVHRLVAKAFSKEVEGKETVNHIDGVKTNNNIYNLEWADHSEQMKHAVKLELLEKRGSPKYTKAFKNSVLNYKLENPETSITKLAELFDLSERTAGRIVNEGVNRRVTGCMTKNGLVHKVTTSQQQVKEIKELRSKGYTLKEIGDLHNLGTSQVWRICKNLSRDNNFEE